jgi:hypothetical protein
MKPIRFVLVLMVVYSALVVTSFAQVDHYGRAMNVYDQIRDVSCDQEKVAEVESLVLIRGAAIFRLNKGKICLFEPIDGRITGAVFVGKGVFEFSPPTEIERHQLKRFTEHESLKEEFKKVCLLFSDTTDAELLRKLSFIQSDLPGGAKSRAKDAPKLCLRETGRNLWCRILADVLADSTFQMSHPDRSNGFLYADIETRHLGRLFFTFDPKLVEEVILEKPDPRPGEYGRDRVCSFHRTEDYLQNPLNKKRPIPHEDKDEIKVTHYKMDTEIDIREELSAKVEMDFESLTDGVRVINFDLVRHEFLEIEQITNQEGDSLYFVREKKDQSGVCVFLSRPTKSGENRKLTFKYSGKEMILQDQLGDLYIRSTTRWYPRYGYLRRATYDLTFRCPKGNKLVSIGEKRKEWVDGDFLCTHWVEDIPVKWASFNYGHYETYEKKVEGIPPVTVYHLEHSHLKTRAKYKKSKENVAADLINSMSFFQNIYCKCPFSKMDATETPHYGGQGLPGLLYLSWGTFVGDAGVPEWKFYDESFRAHEVAHQWWGNIVGWETYHDQWISEGFAEYSGSWYAQLSTADNWAFFKELDEWRKDITGKGSKWSEGTKVGPIWLGPRLSSSKSGDYTTLVYEKGAYVLHMLRNMMMDYDTRSDSSFIAMMRDFAETYYGKEASTEDFQEIVEKHMGEDMDWFFAQWVYGIEVPTYKFSYNTRQTSDGKYVVTCEVDQENVSEGFKMWVPVLLDFGMDQHAILRLWVDKPHNEYQLPKAPLMPRKVTLNPAHAVLCEVKNK